MQGGSYGADEGREYVCRAVFTVRTKRQKGEL